MLWGIDWSEHLPIEVGSAVLVQASSFDRVLPFISDHYAAIFEEAPDSPFKTRLSPHKERYYRLAGDFFAFEHGEQIVGLLVGTPVDWSTYYIRSAAMLPEYQRSGLMLPLLESILAVLQAAGLERVEADTSPSNFATLGILGKLFFNVTGTTLSDRWGAQVRLTRYLDSESEKAFLRGFCGGVHYQLRRGARRERRSP